MSQDAGWADNEEELMKKADFILSKISTLEAKGQKSARDPRRLAVPMKRGSAVSAKRAGQTSSPETKRDSLRKSYVAALDTADFPVVEDSGTALIAVEGD